MTVKRYKTIKDYAEHLLLLTDFTDCYGRRVGLHYDVILARIKRMFPSSRTSMRALRYILHYQIDRAARLPARHRSRKILAREYAKAMLLQRDSHGVGVSLKTIQMSAIRKFPHTPIISLRTLQSWSDRLPREGISLPERRA